MKLVCYYFRVWVLYTDFISSIFKSLIPLGFKLWTHRSAPLLVSKKLLERFTVHFPCRISLAEFRSEPIVSGKGKITNSPPFRWHAKIEGQLFKYVVVEWHNNYILLVNCVQRTIHYKLLQINLQIFSL